MTLTYDEYKTFLRNDFVTFIERSFYELNPQTELILGDYIELLASKLEHCRLGKIKRLIINLPPRFLKSHCASVAFSAWILGKDPSKHIISACYGQDLADKMARDTKTIMSSSWYCATFATRLSPERKATHDFMTTKQGTRMATSVGGVLTGRGADIIIIDDPMKPDEALSETRRKAVIDWFDNTLLSRLNDKLNGCIIIIMQRLHQDDLIGHVLEKGDWEVVSLPAIAEEERTYPFNTIFGPKTFKRSIGEVLHPERDSLETFEDIRKKIGEYHFQSQYQQNPTPVEGNMIKHKWLRFYKPEDLPAKFDSIVQSWDTANKATELSDFSVGTTWGKKGNNYYLLHVHRNRLNYPELKKAVIEQAKLYSARVILIEDKASGTQLIQELKYEVSAKVEPIDPGSSDKLMRVYAQTGAFENGQVYLPTEAHWLDDYIRELTSFPGSKFDDQVDSTTQALEWLRKYKPRGFFDADFAIAPSPSFPRRNRQFTTDFY